MCKVNFIVGRLALLVRKEQCELNKEFSQMLEQLWLCLRVYASVLDYNVVFKNGDRIFVYKYICAHKWIILKSKIGKLTFSFIFKQC